MGLHVGGLVTTRGVRMVTTLEQGPCMHNRSTVCGVLQAWKAGARERTLQGVGLADR